MKVSSRTTTLAISLLLCVSPVAHAYLPGSISGPFYNPEQSGHGITITVANDQRAIAIWHVFDPVGEPLTLYIEGDVEGRRIVGNAYAPEGMRFGEFNPADVQLPHWGSIEIAFDDCSNATLSWDADATDYEDGEMPIRRLVQPSGVNCTLPIDVQIPAGLYLDVEKRYQGLIDDEGVLWGIERDFQPDGYPLGMIPSTLWVGTHVPISFVGTPVSERPVSESESVVSMLASATDLLWLQAPEQPRQITNTYSIYPNGSSGQIYLSGVIFQTPVTLQTGSEDASVSQSMPLSVADLTGTYLVPIRDQLVPRLTKLEIDHDGALCIYARMESAHCHVTGKVAVANAELGIIEFRASHSDNPSLPVYFGRGWMADADYGRELVLVGHPDGGKGFGLVAIKEE
ncbi:MAG: hypothetical protein R3F22_09750 [Lysobacteraceae bacterium]